MIRCCGDGGGVGVGGSWLALMLVRQLLLLHMMDQCSFYCSVGNFCATKQQRSDELAHRGRPTTTRSKRNHHEWCGRRGSRNATSLVRAPRERATKHKTVTVSNSNLSARHSRKSMYGRNDLDTGMLRQRQNDDLHDDPPTIHKLW
jgi:hypothetical protein